MPYDLIYLVTDCVAIVDKTKIILVVRGADPDKGKLALPGGHMDLSDKGIAYTCARELKEETGFVVLPRDLHFLMFLDDPDRGDTRTDRRVSAVFECTLTLDQLEHMQAGDDAAKVVVREITSMLEEEMAFDHWKVIGMLQKRLI